MDWDRTDAAISRDLGVTPAAVGRARKRRGIEPAKQGGPRSPRYDGVDWSRRDSEIARELGVTAQSVASARAARGIPRWGAVDLEWSDTRWGTQRVQYGRVLAVATPQGLSLTIDGLDLGQSRELAANVLAHISRHVPPLEQAKPAPW